MYLFLKKYVLGTDVPRFDEAPGVTDSDIAGTGAFVQNGSYGAAAVKTDMP
jgi:hypothetical protein